MGNLNFPKHKTVDNCVVLWESQKNSPIKKNKQTNCLSIFWRIDSSWPPKFWILSNLLELLIERRMNKERRNRGGGRGEGWNRSFTFNFIHCSISQMNKKIIVRVETLSEKNFSPTQVESQLTFLPIYLFSFSLYIQQQTWNIICQVAAFDPTRLDPQRLVFFFFG